MNWRSVPTANSEREYENVDPPCQTFAEEEWDRFLVDLTGLKKEREFKKEHLRVRVDGGGISLSGERPLGGGGQWLRFEKVFRMPEGRKTDEIRARFANGVLSVVVPKLKSNSQIAAQPAAAAVSPPAAQKPLPPPVTPAPEEGQVKTSKPTKDQGDVHREDLAAAKDAGSSAGEKAGSSKRRPPTGAVVGMRERRQWTAVKVAIAAAAAVAVMLIVGLGFYLRGGFPESVEDLPPPESFPEYY
ncbi:unnamed protein product [Spirodela intermedia]|uniref:SHSP domain-containing protein n=1 Tax=Spirodela intermedia TaxID=51605 RepID=A0A7I8JAJ8_SPIIN|nr:unnamed protein product [Spirodela intermedia]CAA6667140.1 unnamed protein product [Spirodela intermedia]